MSDATIGHVLIVDDDPSISRMFQILLKDAGYRVSIANHGEDVLRFVRVLTPDVVLLDISLPGISGVEVTRRIKHDPSLPFIPIILITALGDMKTKVAGLDAGADDFLIKPVEFAELLARVRVMLRLQQSRRSLQEAKTRIETLLAFSQSLNTSLDVTTLLQRSIALIVDAVGAVRGSVLLAPSSSRPEPMLVSATRAVMSSEAIDHLLREGVVGWVMRAMKPLILPDAQIDQRWTWRESRDSTRSVAAVPIIHDRDVLGVLTLTHNRVGYFENEHIELMQSMAAQSAVVLQHANLFALTTHQKQQLERRSRHLAEILDTGERIRLNLPLDTILTDLARAIRRSLGFDKVRIEVFASGSTTLLARGQAGISVNTSTLTSKLPAATLLPLMRPEFQISRSYSVPQEILYDDSANEELADQSLTPLRGSQPGDLVLTPVGAVNQPTGLIIAAMSADQTTTDLETVQALEIFADQVANAAHNSVLFGREQQRANQMQMLIDVGHNLTELMTPEQLLRLVSSLVQHSFGWFSVAIWLLEAGQFVLRGGAAATGQPPPLGRAVPVAGPLATIVQQPRSLQLIGADALSTEYPWLAVPIQAELVVPIIAKKEFLGVLIVGSDKADTIDESAEPILQTLVTQISIGLQNARLFAREQQQVHQLGLVNALSIKLTAAMTALDQMPAVLADIGAIFNAQRAVLVMFDPATDRSTVAADWSVHPPSDPPVLLPSSIDLLPVLQRTPMYLVADADADAQMRQLLQVLHISTGVIAALRPSEHTFGVLILDVTEQATTWSTSDHNMAQTVANLLAQAIENSRLYQAIADEQRTLSAVLASAADPIILIGAHRELMLFNRAAQEGLGFSSADIGQPLQHPILLEILADNDAQTASEYHLSDGRIVRPSIALHAPRDGVEMGLVVVLQDITALKQLEQQRMERLRHDLLRYMTPPLVEQLLTEERFGEAAERDVAVLFADLRGFTALIEGLEPRIVVEQVLNRFFALMTDVLLDHQGIIDKLLGDGIMAVFGSVRPQRDDTARALSAAIAMQQAFHDLRTHWNATLGRDIGLGIGISFGPAVVGNLGSPQRMDYTLIGDVVNTASRLVDIAAGGQIVVSQQFVNQLEAEQRECLRALDAVALKGKVGRIAIYDVAYTDVSSEL